MREICLKTICQDMKILSFVLCGKNAKYAHTAFWHDMTGP